MMVGQLWVQFSTDPPPPPPVPPPTVVGVVEICSRVTTVGG
jgi:hypothetical protein